MSTLSGTHPGDQLNTNYELHRALIDYSSSTTVYASRTNAIGEKGSTWWVMAKLDEAVYRQKYDGLDLVRRPENDSCTTLRMLMTYAGPSRRYLPAAREWFQRQVASVIVNSSRGCCYTTGSKRRYGLDITT